MVQLFSVDEVHKAQAIVKAKEEQEIQEKQAKILQKEENKARKVQEAKEKEERKIQRHEERISKARWLSRAQAEKDLLKDQIQRSGKGKYTSQLL